MNARAWIAAMIIIGFLLTSSNGVLAYRSSKRHLQNLGKPAHTTNDHADFVLHALQASRLNLMLAGVGLLISSAASVLSLYL